MTQNRTKSTMHATDCIIPAIDETKAMKVPKIPTICIVFLRSS